MTSTALAQSRFALVTAGHHLLLRVLPLREPDSTQALRDFVAAVEQASLPSVEIDAVLLRCLAVLDLRSERRIPSLVERYLSSPYAPEHCVARFVTCLETLLRHHAITDGSVHEAIEYIRTSFTDANLDPQAVARFVNVRLPTLDAAFGRQMHCTITQYIRDVRLEHAAFQLVTTHRSIKEIWAANGYNHHSNFDHDFKPRFGLSPRKFRERAILPLARRHYRAGHEQNVSPSASPISANASVLIIDDDEGTRDTLDMYLRLEGHRVFLATTGAEGLLQIRRHMPDVVLIDYHLDDMDGLDVLRAIRQDLPEEPPAAALFTADWEAFDRADEVNRLNAIVASKLCDLDHVKELIVYLSTKMPPDSPAFLVNAPRCGAPQHEKPCVAMGPL